MLLKHHTAQALYFALALPTLTVAHLMKDEKISMESINLHIHYAVSLSKAFQCRTGISSQQEQSNPVQAMSTAQVVHYTLSQIITW